MWKVWQSYVELECMGINLDKKSGGALTRASAERKPIMSLGAEPPVESRGRGPLKLKAFRGSDM